MLCKGIEGNGSITENLPVGLKRDLRKGRMSRLFPLRLSNRTALFKAQPFSDLFVDRFYLHPFAGALNATKIKGGIPFRFEGRHLTVVIAVKATVFPPTV